PAEEFKDAVEFLARDDRKGKRAMQAVSGRKRRTREVGIGQHIRDPNRRPPGPNLAGQANAHWKSSATGYSLKLFDNYARRLPDDDATKHISLPVQMPEHADLPGYTFANCLQNLGRGLAEEGRFRQDARHRMLGSQEPFGSFLLRNVAKESETAMHGSAL